MIQKAKSIIVFAKTKDISDTEDEAIPKIKKIVSALDYNLVAFVDSLFAFTIAKPTTQELDNISDKSAALAKEIRTLLDTMSHLKS
jgi:hypothetical protein